MTTVFQTAKDGGVREEKCAQDRVCQDRSYIGQWPVCVPDNSTTCGGQTCSSNETCYHNSTGGGYCVPNCNGWWCPRGEVCQDRSYIGQWPVCVPDNNSTFDHVWGTDLFIEPDLLPQLNWQ
eukprot:TRINITY_DN89_c0_g1_i13.p2 TRINITY_DN89_c0_g1~~TRINITY_DN89_c0_g1_i13.p2  ORF type:complete len:122 (+),score=22.62 TRINITY_DN89_c0_g1_i13:216-581(+)